MLARDVLRNWLVSAVIRWFFDTELNTYNLHLRNHDNVEPTNNGSERSLRHAVIWRKLSFGTQSAGGSRFVETMLTVIETCRQQSRDIFDYVTDAIQAHFDNQSPPSILPGP